MEALIHNFKKDPKRFRKPNLLEQDIQIKAVFESTENLSKTSKSNKDLNEAQSTIQKRYKRSAKAAESQKRSSRMVIGEYRN